MLIKVTQEHINAGRRINCTECPVALALKEHYSHVLVAGVSAFVDFKWLELPRYVANWIHKFDNNLPVEPIEFEIR